MRLATKALGRLLAGQRPKGIERASAVRCPVLNRSCSKPDKNRGEKTMMLRASIALAAMPLLALSSSASAQVRPIEWSIEPAGKGPAGDQVQLTIESRWEPGNHSVWSNSFAVSEISGLTMLQVSGPRGPVRFALVRDAGRLDCGGELGGYRGNGTCTFSADQGFLSYLSAQGIGQPTVRQAFTLAMSRVSRDLIESMQSIGYARPDIKQLTSMAIHGVSAEYVRGLAASGYRLKSADDLVKFKIHGVSIDYIRELAAISPELRQIDAADLVNMRIHGVKPDYVRAMAAMGPEFRSLSADDLIAFRIHGAKPEMVRAFAKIGEGPLKRDEVVAMAIHGVSAGYIDELMALGYRDMRADDLVRMRIHGVTPDYVRRLQQEGMTSLSADQLVRLRVAGYSPRRP